MGVATKELTHDFSVTLSSGAADANLYNVYPLQDFSYAVTFSTMYVTCSTSTASVTFYTGYSTQPATNLTGQAAFLDAAVTGSSTTYTGGTFSASGIISAGQQLIVKVSGMAADAIVKITGVFTRN